MLILDMANPIYRCPSRFHATQITSQVVVLTVPWVHRKTAAQRGFGWESANEQGRQGSMQD